MPEKSAEMPEQSLPSGLYIIATPIGNMGDMTRRAIETLGKVDIIACEDTRETGKLTSLYGAEGAKIPYHDHNAAEMRPKIIDMIRSGKSVGLVSDAGMPLISDPGYKLVEACVAEGFHVTCMPGASASLTALVLSGLPSDRFMFAGFLPPKTSARRAALDELKSVPATLVFYETAPRLLESLEDMAEILGDRPAAVARELTKKFEEVRRGLLSELAVHYKEAGDPKGEIAIVVGAPVAGAEENWTDADIDVLLTDLLLRQGMSVKDASGLAASKSGRKKSDVYERALRLKDKK
jgi:16S rRNA (cytidine1402-2'-O)-methyltransferase